MTYIINKAKENNIKKINADFIPKAVDIICGK